MGYSLIKKNRQVNIQYKGQIELFTNGFPHHSATYNIVNLICIALLGLIISLHNAPQLCSISFIKETFGGRFPGL